MERKNILKYWEKSIFDKYIKYNSEREAAELKAQIPATACTFIHFKNENIIVIIDQNKHVFEFYNQDEQLIISGNLPEVTEGRNAYPEITYGVEKDNIIFKLPVCRWIDNYPHCDGESDRWDTEILGFHIYKFNLITKSITTVLFN